VATISAGAMDQGSAQKNLPWVRGLQIIRIGHSFADKSFLRSEERTEKAARNKKVF